MSLPHHPPRHLERSVGPRLFPLPATDTLGHTRVPFRPSHPPHTQRIIHFQYTHRPISTPTHQIIHSHVSTPSSRTPKGHFKPHHMLTYPLSPPLISPTTLTPKGTPSLYICNVVFIDVAVGEARTFLLFLYVRFFYTCKQLFSLPENTTHYRQILHIIVLISRLFAVCCVVRKWIGDFIFRLNLIIFEFRYKASEYLEKLLLIT